MPFTPEPRITRAPLGELDAIERGGPDSLYPNFGILFASTAISFKISLATTEIKSIYMFNGFFIVTTVAYAAAVVLGFLWIRSLKAKKSVIASIRNRRPPPGEPLPMTPAAE